MEEESVRKMVSGHSPKRVGVARMQVVGVRIMRMEVEKEPTTVDC